MWRKLITKSGINFPLGATRTQHGMNFSLHAPHGANLVLGFFEPNQTTPSIEIPLDPAENKTAGIWHIEVDKVPKDAYYAFRINDEWILDPYAKQLNTTPTWGESPSLLLGKIEPDTNYNWEDDQLPKHPFETLIIYEMHVRGFTKDVSSQTEYPGTFLGVIEKIPYLTQLGINAVELMPIFAFDETAYAPLTDYWGYTPINFFAPMSPYGTIDECKEMIHALHKAGIEVILDVVYNHADIPAFTQLDKSAYFILDETGNHTNYTGCGNTLNCNHPVMMNLTLTSLRYWAEEMHIDGFRFDLASIFFRDEKGGYLEKPPILQAILNDSILSTRKLIAEPWDCAGLYQVGGFPEPFAEWNGAYRDTIRRFFKGDKQQESSFATRQLGSPDLFSNRPSYQTINFITAHDGFTLRDLVSYNQKHNEENEEEGKDGAEWNESWNCGIEGPTNDPAILRLRELQMRNFLLALGLSIGTPMFSMGDEYGHTRDGNNNAYCQDNKKNHFLWNQLEKNTTLYDFYRAVLAFRKKHSIFQKNSPLKNDLCNDNHFVSYLLKSSSSEILLAYNASSQENSLDLPQERNWIQIFNTNLEKQKEKPVFNKIEIPAHSCVVLLA